jgi:hypothetical protein
MGTSVIYDSELQIPYFRIKKANLISMVWELTDLPGQRKFTSDPSIVHDSMSGTHRVLLRILLVLAKVNSYDDITLKPRRVS